MAIISCCTTMFILIPPPFPCSFIRDCRCYHLLPKRNSPCYWKFHSINKIAFQQVHPDVLSLPALAVSSSNYIEHVFNFKSTEGKLKTIIGFDLFYNTSYYANAYMPSMAIFYQQQEKQLGNYPYVDVFLNVRLKRVRFFMNYEHINSGWLEKNFFTTLHYPMDQRYLKIGISWTFYD